MFHAAMEMVTRAVVLRTASLIRREVAADLMADDPPWEWMTEMHESPGGWQVTFHNPREHGPRKLVVTIHTEG